MNKTEGTFTQRDVNLLTSIATYAAITIHNAHLHENVLKERDRVLEIEEKTRKVLARELHDGLTQQISEMVMRLDFCRRAEKENPALLTSELTAIQELGKEIIHMLRTRLVELRPLEVEEWGQGLAAALHGFLERRQKEVQSSKLSLNILSYHPDNQILRQDPQLEKAIFNIVQESVNNAIKHAQAKSIEVQLEEAPDILRIVIADNGKGFNVSQTMQNYSQRGSLGMINIQERAEAMGGELVISSTSSQGTCITLEVPKSKTARMQKRGTTGRLTLPASML